MAGGGNSSAGRVAARRLLNFNDCLCLSDIGGPNKRSQHTGPGFQKLFCDIVYSCSTLYTGLSGHNMIKGLTAVAKTLGEIPEGSKQSVFRVKCALRINWKALTDEVAGIDWAESPGESGSEIYTNLLEELQKYSRRNVPDRKSVLENGQDVDVIYLDFSKAFDRMDHGLLLGKLKALGINGRLITWIKSFLLSRRQRVVVDGRASEWYDVQRRVPQVPEQC